MAKIGQSARLKAEEAAPYITLGIVKVSDGYELRKVTISGLEVVHMKVLKKETERAAIMMELNIALINYNINFNQKESGE